MVCLVLLGALAVASAALAQRPNYTTICDYYTPKILNKPNSPASQLELMTVIVNTFILGNYSPYQQVNVTVAGITAPAQYHGATVNLLSYFNGGWASTNRGGSEGMVVNFLDDGGAGPLQENKPADGTDSNQYRLLTHIYQYFGTFYGCSYQGNSSAFPSYQGKASQYEVHKFMDLDSYEMGFFIDQVCYALTSLGFEQLDIDTTRSSLDLVFNRRCTPAKAIIPHSAGPQLQACCIASNCLSGTNPSCAAYSNDDVSVSEYCFNPPGSSSGIGGASSTGSASSSTHASGSGSASTSSSPSATTTPTSAAGQMLGVSLTTVAAAVLLVCI
ncbi:hypothetical protein POJ06DRAFT_290727, partial [Lipomyces tetrasporus]